MGFTLRVEAGPEVNYNVALDGDLWGNPFSSRFRFDDDFQLSGMNMSLSAFGLQTEAGNISADWDDLGLAGRSFQGIKTGFGVGKADVSLLGGTVILQPDVLRRPDLLEEREVSSIVSPVYGVRASLPIGRHFNLNASQLFTPKATSDQGNGITTFGLKYQPAVNRRLALEVARSRQGTGWQISGATEKGRLKVQGSYRQVGQGFSTAGNPALRTRRNGGQLSLQYRIAQPLTLSASSQRYDDESGGLTKSDSVNFRFAQRNKPSLNLFWRSAEIARPAVGSSGARSTSSATAGLRVSHKLGVNRLSFQYARNQFSTTGIAESSTNTDRFSLGWSRPLGRQTEMSLTQALDLSETDQGQVSRTIATALDFRHRVGRSGIRLDLGIQYANRLTDDTSGQAIFLRTGFNYQMKSGSSIGLQYRTRIVASGSLNSITTDRLYVSYSHRFGSKKRGASKLSKSERRQLGKIAGRVFEDKNINGKWDEGEPGISEVAVRKQGGTQLQTDQDGRFSINDIRPGDHQLHIITKTLPIEFTTVTPTQLSVAVSAGQSATVDFPVVRTGQAKGIVFSDTNRNGLRDEGEMGIANAIVQVEGSDVIGFTDAQGNFTLHGLVPKTWSLSVNTGVLGEEMEATGEGKASVQVPANGEVEGAALGVAEKERAVVNSFEKVQ